LKCAASASLVRSIGPRFIIHELLPSMPVGQRRALGALARAASHAGSYPANQRVHLVTANRDGLLSNPQQRR